MRTPFLIAFGLLSTLIGCPVQAQTVPPTAPAVPKEADPIAPFMGNWTRKEGTTTLTLGLVPDGRYFFTRTLIKDPIRETGRYRIEGDRLLLKSRTRDASYRFERNGAVMDLTGGEFTSPARFTKQAGSEKTLADEVSKADEARAKEDAEWKAKIPVATRPETPPLLEFTDASLPKDGNGARIFPGATVFSEFETYTEANPMKPWTSKDGSKKEVKDSRSWYFFPNGRVFAKERTFTPGGPDEGQLAYAWGRYRIEADGPVESLFYERDGEAGQSFRLMQGRRAFVRLLAQFENLDWVKEQLRRNQDELQKQREELQKRKEALQKLQDLLGQPTEDGEGKKESAPAPP